jgi:pimeloyl-ACP methyl ester carboxylesterase
MSAAAITAGHFLEVSPGIRLHYASGGDTSSPLMLFVHGFPEFWFGWMPLLPSFVDRFHVVAPDLRGFNLSSKPTELSDYKAPKLIGDLAGLIERLGYRKAVVVAHDWGGALAWGLAIARPELVERLVILNAPHPVPFARALAHDEEQQRASEYMNWLRSPGAEETLAANDFERLDALFSRFGEAAWFDASTRAEYHRAWGQPGALACALNYYRASPLYPPSGADPGAARLTLREQDFTVRVPTLVIWGEDDAALRPVLLEGLDAVVPDLRIERLAGASHWLVHEQPQAIAASIGRFVAGSASDGA